MSEREKEIIRAITENLSKLSEFEKGYILGIVEGKTSGKREQEEEA